MTRNEGEGAEMSCGVALEQGELCCCYASRAFATFHPFLSLQVEWAESKGGANLQLKGGPVFLRVCLMGQLRYSDIKVPAFPVALDLTTRFERVS